MASVVAKWGQISIAEVVEKDIDEACDYDEMFDMADLMGVDLAGLDEIDEMKERLLMHLKQDGNENDKTVIVNSMVDCQRDDKQKRDKLIEMLRNCQKTLIKFQVPEFEANGRRHKRGSHAIEDLLKTEGTSNNFEIDFKEKLNNIHNGDCVIVVSGETSSGKSSTLNLLFGREVLPVHHNSCTSVITRISYAKTYSSTVVFNDGTERKFTDPGRVKEDLWEMIYVKDEAGRDLVTSIKEVHMKIPSEILKSGLVFIDSPGIGENEAMDSIIAEFVEENDIMGFMYVIKSDNAGGVEEDRLISLVKLVLEKQMKKSKMSTGMSVFDPKNAIFVCNRWDLVNRDQEEEVFENAVTKLSECWPNLEREQVIRISTYRAEKEVEINPNYITTQYKNLLSRIKDIFIKAQQRKIESTYKWIERVLIRSVHHLKTLVRNLDSSERDLEDRMKTTYEKLQTIKKKAKVVIQDLNVRVAEKYQNICQEFRQELLKPYSKLAITNWIASEVPEAEDREWEMLKEVIDFRISNRVAEQLEKWQMDTERIKSVQEMVVNDIKIHLQILQDEVDVIENDIADEPPPASPPGSRGSTINIFRRSCRPSDGFLQPVTMPTTKLQSTLCSSIADLTIPAKVNSKLTKPVTTFMKRSRISKMFDDRKTKKYTENPCKVVKERAEKILKRLTHPDTKAQDFLQDYLNSYMRRPLEYLSIVEKNIPRLIASNEQLLDHVASSRVNTKESRVLYEDMMEGLEELKRHLMQYGHGHIFVDDFVNDAITLQDDSDGDGATLTGTFKVSDIILQSSTCREVNRRSIPRGLWTALQMAVLTRKEEEIPVTIRVYLPSSGVEYTFPEVSKLRFLNNKNIAEFLGIHHSDAPTPAFVYNGHLRSAKRYLRSTLSLIPDEVDRIIKQTARGLDYLHRKKLVHMELNINTVTVDQEGMVKLTGGCLPRMAVFPLEKEKVEVGDFVYLSPAVLAGSLYIACSDVYAFGLFLLELLQGGQAFKDQRNWTLDRFCSNVNPHQMLDLKNKLVDFKNDNIRVLIENCVELNVDDRPAASAIVEKLAQIRFADEAIMIPQNSRKNRKPYKSKKETKKIM